MSNSLLRSVHLCSLISVVGRPRHFTFSAVAMAKSKFEYVKTFEDLQKCLPSCWMVVRLDGKGFHKFTKAHDFDRPNDKNGLELMSKAAASVMDELRDIVIAFGHSDEYSFVFRKETTLHNRREQKILSLVCSLFSSSYVFYWSQYFNTPLKFPPSFDGRLVLYPTDGTLRDYMSWRQADVHVNNLYNLCFWSLVLKKGLKPTEAEERLRGTLTADKNELLFQEFNINYNKEPEMFRKGTTLIRKLVQEPDSGQPSMVIVPVHCDIIKDKFWTDNGEILSDGAVPRIPYSETLLYYSTGKRVKSLKNCH